MRLTVKFCVPLQVPWMRFNVKPCVTLQGLWMGLNVSSCRSRPSVTLQDLWMGLNVKPSVVLQGLWTRFNVKPCVTLQGLWMGFLTACGSLARTLGPIFVAQIYDAWGPRVTFASTCAILAVTIGINCATYRRLVPFATSSYRKRSSDQGGGRRNGSVYVNPTGSLQ